MQKLLARLRDVVWPAVLAAVLAPLAVVVALVAPEMVSLTLSLGLAGVTMALLATRA